MRVTYIYDTYMCSKYVVILEGRASTAVLFK